MPAFSELGRGRELRNHGRSGPLLYWTVVSHDVSWHLTPDRTLDDVNAFEGDFEKLCDESGSADRRSPTRRNVNPRGIRRASLSPRAL